MVDELILSFQVLTPLFMGDASQAAELRPPAFKGLLRFWYRALDPRYNAHWDGNGTSKITREDHMFGGCAEGAGQSPFLMRIHFDNKPVVAPWDKNLAARFNQGSGKNTRNGLVYLGFPFQMGKRGDNGKVQTAIPPGCSFTVHCVIPQKNTSEELRRTLLASCWALSHLGGAGSRARRGFGGLVLKEWQTKPEPWPELTVLPLLSKAKTGKEWSTEFSNALQTIRRWFGDFNSNTRHPHLGDSFKAVLLPKSFQLNDWAPALNHAGLLLQDFRVRRAPDYKEVRDHLLARNKAGGRFLQSAPSRATFGLPLTFRYSSVRGGVDLLPYDDFMKSTGERHGSLLHIRLAALADGLYPLFVRMSGDVPGMSPPVAVRGQRVPLRPPRENAMELFLDSLSKR